MKRLATVAAALAFVAFCIATEPTHAATRHHHHHHCRRHCHRHARPRVVIAPAYHVSAPASMPVGARPPAPVEEEPEPPSDATGCEGPWASLAAGNTLEEVAIDTEIREWCEEGAPLPTDQEIEADAEPEGGITE